MNDAQKKRSKSEHGTRVPGVHASLLAREHVP